MSNHKSRHKYPIADYVAQTLYKEGNAMFMHKHYNELYPVVSFMEDKS